MGLLITVLALCFTIVGLVMVCFYAPCLWDLAVSVNSKARGRRTDLATVSADAAALRDTDQRRGIANPLVPPNYTEEDELAVPAHRRQHRSCYMLSAGQLRIDGEPPPAYSAPQWCRQPAPTDSAESSAPAWQELDAALWLLQQAGWRPPAAAAAAGDPPPQYTETSRPTAPVEDGASDSGHQQRRQGRHPAETCQPTAPPLTPRQFQQRWERLGAAAASLHQPPPAYSAADPLDRSPAGCPAGFPPGKSALPLSDGPVVSGGDQCIAMG